MDFKFTQDWFSHNIQGLETILPLLPDNKKFLEIGAFEGRASVWFASKLGEKGVLICIDTWEGSEEHTNIDFKEVEKNFEHNLNLSKHKIIKLKGTSIQAYQSICLDEFDLIYIDGSHTAPDVMTDAVMYFNLLKKGGVMVFDDYLWGKQLGVLHNPKIAIDTFTSIYSEKLDICMIGYQLAIKKR